MSNKNGSGMNKFLLRKTSNIFEHYYRVLKEQGENVPAPEEGFDTSGGQSPDITQNPQPEASQEEMPMTSEGEEKYIADLLDAALFEPSSEDARTLSNLQGVMRLKRYKNAREEILPLILNIIRPSTESTDIRDGLDKLNQ